MQKASVNWEQVRTAYMSEWPRVTFTALAEEYGAARTTIARRARRERWAFHARVASAERQVREHTQELAHARRQAAEVGRAVVAFAKDKRITDAQLAAEAVEASTAIRWVHFWAFNLAGSRRSLADAQADRRPDYTRGPALEDLSGRPEWDRVGAWAMESRHGPRKPFPWEKRRTAAARRAA